MRDSARKVCGTRDASVEWMCVCIGMVRSQGVNGQYVYSAVGSKGIKETGVGDRYYLSCWLFVGRRGKESR